MQISVMSRTTAPSTIAKITAHDRDTLLAVSEQVPSDVQDDDISDRTVAVTDAVKKRTEDAITLSPVFQNILNCRYIDVYILIFFR